MPKKIKITKETEGRRLDIFLAKNGYSSRSQTQKLIKQGNVTIGGKKARAGQRLREGDEIVVSAKKPVCREKPAGKKPAVEKPRILEETADYLIVDKPAGLVVHPAPGVNEPTLAEILVKRYPEIKEVGDDPDRPGIVHRLDREASGLLAVARGQKFFKALKKQFQQRKVGKKYLALVYGKLPRDEGEINFPIARASGGGKMAARPVNQEGREAITNFKTIKKFINFTLLELTIKTGRTHQIRCHLAAFGHPIVGDELYGTPKTERLNEKLGLNRIFLAAEELSFVGPTGAKKIFRLSLPKELKELMKKIK